MSTAARRPLNWWSAGDPMWSITDVRMPVLDGVDTTRQIVARTSGAAAGSGAQRDDRQVRVLVLTTFHVDQAVYAALRAGASGFILKDASADRAGRGGAVDRRRRGLAGPRGRPTTDRRIRPSRPESGLPSSERSSRR